MDNEKIEEIKQILHNEKAKFWKTEEIEDYIRTYNLDNAQLMTILDYLVDDDYIFKWLDFICKKLPQVAEENNFVDLLKKIISKIKNDMAQGNFIRALINIGEKDARLGVSLYQEMILNRDIDLIAYSSLPLGGAGKKQYGEVFALIKDGFNNQSPYIKAASVKALRVVFEGANKLREPDEIFKLLHMCSSEGEDPIVRLEAAKAFFDFSRFRYEYCVQHLFEFAKSRNSEIRFTLANTMMLQDLQKREDGIEILAMCAKDENKNVLSRVALALSRKGSEFPEKSLRIIKEWIVNGKYFDVYEVDYAIREIGKTHLARCINEVVSWIKEKDEKDHLQFFIPIVLSELSSQNYMQLISSVKTWCSKNRTFQRMALQTIKKVLTDIYPPDTNKLDIVDYCFQLLSEIATSKSIDVEQVIHSESDKVFQCLRIIEEVEGKRKKPVFGVVMKNLDEYPCVRDFIGIKWFESMKEKKNATHPLLLALSSELNATKLETEIEAFRIETDNLKRYVRSLRIQNMLTPIAFLNYLDEMLRVLFSKSAKLKALKAGFRNENQFWETISEIETISSFIEKYNVEIAPELNGKKLDLKVNFNSEEIYIEVISPTMFKPLKFLSGKAMSIKNRARGKILDELANHFRDSNALGKIPWVIVIDIGRSEMSYDFIEDALIGSMRLTLLLDKEKGAVHEQAWSRADDSVHDIRKATDILSAIVCYKVNLGNDFKFHREGKIIPNPYAKNPISKATLTKIEKSLLK